MSFFTNNSLKNTSSSSSFLKLKLAIIAIALTATLVLVTSFESFKDAYEERIGSYFWTVFPDTTPEERITIVAIDEESLAQVGPWPWSRETLTQLSNKLRGYGSSMQLYDIVFPEMKPGDEGFVDALTENNAVIGQVPVLNSGQPIRKGVLTNALNKVRCQYPIPNSQNYLANDAIFKDVRKGHITPIIDGDGQVRQQPPLICIDGQVYPSLALQGLISSLELDSDKKAVGISISSNSGLFNSDWKLSFDSYFGLNIPMDSDGNMRISYRQTPDVFQVVSASKVLDGSAPKSLLNGTWALIGATAFGLGDVVPTPYSGVSSGVEIQARLISSLIDGKIPYSPTISKYILISEGILGSLILLSLGYKRNRSSAYSLPIATILLPSLTIALHAYLLSHSLWLGWFSVSLYLLVLGSLLTLFEHAIVRDERHRILGHLSSYLPKTVAQRLMQSVPSGSIEAYRRDLVLLSADLRNFSAYEESRSPEEAAALLHCFFVNATETIESYGGQVEEYTGDAILSSWTTSENNNATLNALEAATKLQSCMQSILPSRAVKGLEPLALGIGIERGATLVGSIGPAHRRAHTLLGDTVTITLRIQEMTQDLAQPILLGECAARDLNGTKLVSQGSFLLDGLRTPHVLFAPNIACNFVEPIKDESVASFRIVKAG